MPNISEFERTQQAVEKLFDQYDVLLQDYARHEACTILAARHQIDRYKVVALINDRDAGIIGGSGESSVSAQGTPTAGTA